MKGELELRKCYARDYCKLYKTDKCNNECGVYSLLRAIYLLSGIPKKYRYNIPLYPEKHDIDTFKALQDYMLNIEDNVEEGKSIYIWSSTTGNGKTTWSTKIANYYIRKAAATGRLSNIVKYINVPAYLDKVRQSFDADSKSIEELNEQILNADLVIFDDIGAEKVSEWVQERLYTIVNYRDNELKSSIFTSNVSPTDLKIKLGDRLYSRIITSNEVYEIRGGDKRCMNNN